VYKGEGRGQGRGEGDVAGRIEAAGGEVHGGGRRKDGAEVDVGGRG